MPVETERSDLEKEQESVNSKINSHQTIQHELQCEEQQDNEACNPDGVQQDDTTAVPVKDPDWESSVQDTFTETSGNIPMKDTNVPKGPAIAWASNPMDDNSCGVGH